MIYLGLDVHSANFTLAHLNAHGKLCRMYDRTTSASTLIDTVGKVRGPKTLVVEECHLAQWVKHVLEPYVDHLIICDPKRNRWIAGDEFSDDRSSARKLAELLRGGFVKEVAHPDDHGADRRALFLHYYRMTREVSRAKGMLKAVFRQIAIRSRGTAIYQADDREAWLEQFEEFPALKLRAQTYFELVDVYEQKKQLVFTRLRKTLRQEPAFDLLQTTPGVGPVIAGGYVALIETPHRFSRKNKLWSYAGLGTRRHDSDDRTYANQASRCGCRPLKWLVMQQFNAALRTAKNPNRYKTQYQRLIQGTTSTKAARRHVCRTMLSAARAMWMKGEPYREMS